MSLSDDKKAYRDMAIEAFFAQENGCEIAYQEVFEDLAKCFSNVLPQGKLYRYRSNINWKYTKPIIEKNEVYLCPLDKQNDPFEFAFNDDFGEIVKQVPQLKQMSNINDFNKSLFFQDILDNKCKELMSYKSRMSIACFCEEKDNILLWAHYSNSSRGICIEYSALDLLQCFQCFPLPVVYQRALPTFPLIEEINKLSSFKMVFEMIATKSEMWSYEKEWRIVSCIEPGENHCIDFPNPTAIYLGCNSSRILENRLFELCVKKRIPLYKLIPDKYSYSFIEEELFIPPKSKGANQQ